MPKEANLSLGTLFLRQGDIDKAIICFKTAADLDCVEAYEQLGNIYSLEKYGINNSELALTYFEKAANFGSSNAAYNAACVYEGNLLTRNPERALFWYRKAAEKKCLPALHNLGMKYLTGEDVVKNNEDAFNLFSEASAQDFAPAINEMGSCFKLGLGTKPDLEAAVKCFFKAYNMGSTQAGHNLATIYYEQYDIAADDSSKKEAFGKAIAIWEALTKKKDALSFLT